MTLNQGRPWATVNRLQSATVLLCVFLCASASLRVFLFAAGKILDIRVLDHVILGRGDTRYHSLRESGLASFES